MGFVIRKGKSGAHPTRVEYIFGPFRFVPDECLLLREGAPVAITPQAFDLLRLLVESALVAAAFLNGLCCVRR